MGSVNIGKQIKMLRRFSGLTQKAFAASLGITQSRISNYETGKQMPPIPLLVDLANEYHVSYDWLFTGEIEPEKSFH